MRNSSVSNGVPSAWDAWIPAGAASSADHPKHVTTGGPPREIDPVETTDHLRRTYLRYLKTLYPIRSDDLRSKYWQALDSPNAVVTGPLLEGSAPFQSGAAIATLVEEGLLSARFATLGTSALPIDRPLYAHQERAIRATIQDRRNIVVATGTGSGKTESFLIPILNELFRESEASTHSEPGVRALLLYPMNALANDQMKRLRDLLEHAPDVTFGRYTGETLQAQDNALKRYQAQFPGQRPLPNEFISRDQMQKHPPHILLTNYAMLEYLLLRPQDSVFFDGPTSGRWKYLVVDEAHTYAGANGIEVAMLLRRLKDRIVAGEVGRLRCIATSATLGRGRSDYPKVAEFASEFFGEVVEWVHDDPHRQDVVEAERIALMELPPTEVAAFNPDMYGRLRAAWESGTHDLVAQLSNTARAFNVRDTWINDAMRAAQKGSVEDPDTYRAASQWLATILQHDARLFKLRETLDQQGAMTLDEAAQLAIGPSDDERSGQLVNLVYLASKSKLDDADGSLMPARYHLFVRALEGAYVCFADHGGSGPMVFLARHEECPEPGCGRSVFEIATCIRCGGTYIVSALDGQRLVPYVERDGRKPVYVLLDEHHVELDEDDIAAEMAESSAPSTSSAETVDANPIVICIQCGSFSSGAESTPACPHAANSGNRRSGRAYASASLVVHRRRRARS